MKKFVTLLMSFILSLTVFSDNLIVEAESKRIELLNAQLNYYLEGDNKGTYKHTESLSFYPHGNVNTDLSFDSFLTYRDEDGNYHDFEFYLNESNFQENYGVGMNIYDFAVLDQNLSAVGLSFIFRDNVALVYSSDKEFKKRFTQENKDLKVDFVDYKLSQLDFKIELGEYDKYAVPFTGFSYTSDLTYTLNGTGLFYIDEKEIIDSLGLTLTKEEFKQRPRYNVGLNFSSTSVEEKNELIYKINKTLKESGYYTTTYIEENKFDFNLIVGDKVLREYKTDTAIDLKVMKPLYYEEDNIVEIMVFSGNEIEYVSYGDKDHAILKLDKPVSFVKMEKTKGQKELINERHYFDSFEILNIKDIVKNIISEEEFEKGYYLDYNAYHSFDEGGWIMGNDYSKAIEDYREKNNYHGDLNHFQINFHKRLLGEGYGGVGIVGGGDDFEFNQALEVEFEIKSLKDKNFKIVKVEDGKLFEVPYTIKNNKVRFNTMKTGSFSIVQYTESEFNDVKLNNSFHNYIMDLFNDDIISGYSDGTFRPNNSLTRAQAAVMIVRAAEISTDGAQSNFKDVSSTHNTYKFISAAYEAGIINGYSDGTFKPNDNVTRAQIATMVARAFNLKKEGNPPKFVDVERLSSTGLREYIYTLSSLDIVKGYDDEFRPNNNVTRGQFSKMVSIARDPGKYKD